MNQQVLRQIPSVDKVLNWPEILPFLEKWDPEYVTRLIREQIEKFREQLKQNQSASIPGLKESILKELQELEDPYFRYAINAVGIVLHTGLGRAPFSPAITRALTSVGGGYCRLQIDDQGRRGDRYKKIEQILRLITQAEAGIFVNNNAAATMLILNALAKGREVIVSRGQLIEIGGSFRIPDIMEQSGAIMREVGTTNRTHLKDYETAINENTGAILRVHQSNYHISGFTKEVSLEELVSLGKKYQLPVVDDIGSGAFIDFSKYGLPKEPLVQESVQTGADVICFSGDKLIAGPQCGIIVGKKKLIDKMRKNPLMRSLRCDKLTHATLEATLTMFLQKESDIIKNNAVMQILLKPLKDIKNQASRCAKKIRELKLDHLNVSIEQDVSEIGGGSLSTEQLPTYVVAIQSSQYPIQELARLMRLAPTPVFGRVGREKYLLDFRTVFPGEEKWIIQALQTLKPTV